MSENKIKEAIDSITISPEQKEKMYQNIQKKALQKEKGSFSMFSFKQKPVLFLRYALAAVGCLGILAIGIHQFFPANDPADPPVYVGGQIENPYVSVENAKAFEELSISLDCPENSYDVSYSIINGEIAQVIFSIDEKSYLARAWRQEEDLSGFEGETISEEILQEQDIILLTTIQLDNETYYKISWSKDDVNYCLYSTDIITSQQLITIYQNLKK